jgi:1,4-dihydroxy-2-naphthoate octaprenyltransferase
MATITATVLKSTRPPFLLLPLVVVFLGMAVSLNAPGNVNWFFVLLVFIAAISAHVSVNTLNEYQDFKSGLDYNTNKTPFSGGSGSLVEHPSGAPYVLGVAVGSLLLTIAIGAYFITYKGAALLPLGLVGVATIITYTKWINRSPLLCLIAPGVAFGPLMILGTETVVTGTYSQAAVGVSVVVFCQVNNLLLLNQFPDIKADREIGRWHFPIAYGVVVSAWVYGVLTAISCAAIVLMVYEYLIPTVSLLALLPASAGFVVMVAELKFPHDIPKLTPFMGMNVGITLLTPLVLAVVLLVA